ncbi:putative 2OG-Fe(II) oxygenase [Thalassotalea sp. PS06]|uniref:putative 2OG-Fe(II) oxygenase n=1 Tax=Thalassotalea sp. PS06 TaxID=2594005 RepID=UPI0011631EA5|nr:putative 2OG-Fe(II) oxygenase [Thalassotalea sp. PS06]QDP01331.1 tetratricopeptide repeat protein [Thalassotalea sp. PS06]
MHNRFQAYLVNAMQALKQNQFQLAAQNFDQLTALIPKNPKLYKPAIVAYLNSGQLDKARVLLPDYLTLYPSDADLHNVYGDLAKKQGDHQTAKKHFLKAIAVAPAIAAFQYNLALMHYELAEYDTAARLLNQITEKIPGHLNSWLLLIKVQLKLKTPQQALNHLETLADLHPDAAARADVVKLSILTSIQLQDSEQALQWIRNMSKSALTQGDIEDFCLGFLDGKQPVNALKALNFGLEIFPNALQLLNLNTSLRHELGEDEPLSCWQNITDWSLPLVVGFSQTLLLLSKPEDALNNLQKFENRYQSETDYCVILAQVYLALSRYQDVVAIAQSNKTLSVVAPFQEYLVKALIALGENPQALATCEKLLQENSNDQYIRALYASCLRINDRGEYQQWYDYQHLVLKTKIQVPDGYASVDEFNQCLEKELRALHVMNESPLSQSVTGGGTQTPGYLFNNKADVIQSLKNTLEKSWRNAIDNIEFSQLAKSNPLHQGFTGNLQWLTAWSIQNRTGGFHLPHIHSKGLFSAVYYVKIPEQVAQSDEAESSGYLGFGKPDLPVDLEYDHKVKPVAGELVIFPSFFWHGTLPFTDDSERIVVAFDLNVKE